MHSEQVRRLYEKHGSALLAYGCAVLGDRAAAEDVLQQVFLVLLREDISPIAPEPYLFRAVRNAALNVRRQSSRNVPLDDHQEWFEAPAEKKEAALGLQTAIRRLPEEQREVVVMHVWGELTLEEIATVLEISPNTVASRYRYGLAKLREALRAYEGRNNGRPRDSGI
jgi:RNA polymerase sigma-70 factor (ECF subfamily)